MALKLVTNRALFKVNIDFSGFCAGELTFQSVTLSSVTNNIMMLLMMMMTTREGMIAVLMITIEYDQ